MSVDKVQLQQQEIVNNDVVLTDINPITTTDSVFDTSTGSTMQETLDRIWNAINSRLARYVNSVNNKTGVVVLDPSDVGLSKVDNVSFNEIKNWVIDYFKSMMKNHQLRLFDDFQEAENLLTTQDQSLDSVSFFAESYSSNSDNRAYIGYYYWNEEQEALLMEYKTINVVAKTDASINYNKGDISVRIHPDETALYVDDTNPDRAGLRIRPDKFASKLIECDCLYGDVNATDRMLSAYSSTDGDPVRIYIDDIEVTTTHGHHLHTGWVDENNEPIVLRENQQILTSFGKFYDGGAISGNPQLKGPNATFDLMDRQPAVGVVTKIPTAGIPNDNYVIKFYSIKTFTSGLGTKYYENHGDSVNGVKGTQLGVDFAISNQFGNVAGVTAQIADGLLPSDSTASVDINVGKQLAYNSIQPFGFGGNKSGHTVNHGIIIPTDESICRYPVHMYNPAGEHNTADYYGSKSADNWSPIAWFGFSVDDTQVNGDITPDGSINGYPGPTNYLSVNLNKLIRDTNFTLVHGRVAPADWESNYRNYWYKKNVSDTSDDVVFEKVTGSEAPTWSENTYYTWNNSGYKFHYIDISGLRLNHFDPNKAAYTDPTVPNRPYATFSEDDQKSVGIYDGKDSLGNPIEPIPHTNVSGGLSVNVGNFLEIWPKGDTIGETYEESGKVNVRIGHGLRDDYVIDTDFDGYTPVIEDGRNIYDNAISNGVLNMSVLNMTNPPPDYYTNPERYAGLTEYGEIVPITEIDGLDKGLSFRLIPPQDRYFMSRWDTHYFEYYMYDETRGYYHVPQQMESPEFVENTYFYYGPAKWIDVSVFSQQTFLYRNIVRVLRTNRIAVAPDHVSIKVNERDGISVNYDNESLRVAGPTDAKCLRSYPIARPVEDRYYYPGEIFSSEHRDILYMVKDPNGVDITTTNLNDLIEHEQVKVFREQELGLRRLVENEEYHVGDLVYGLVKGNISGTSPGSDHKRNFTIAMVKRDFVANSNYMDGLFRDKPSSTDYVHSMTSTIMHDESIGRTGLTPLYNSEVKVYAEGVDFYANQLFTDTDKTGFYMAKDDFTASGTIGDDMNHILVIKSPT